jgi:predicted alpha/beta-hydrolase family hydrolase
MRGWASRLSTLGTTVSFDYPYMKSGKKTPDRPPVLIAAHREAIAGARERNDGPLVLAGKSMGGRIGCHVALEEPTVKAVICFGYPLAAPGGRGPLRDAVLLELRVPILFLQGTRDPLCPLDQLEKVRARMQAPSRLYAIEGGDHSLVVKATTLRAEEKTQGDVDQRILSEVAGFLDMHAKGIATAH